MRAKELIGVLSKKEKREFETKLTHHARASLLNLFIELCANENASKETLFFSFSKKKYRKEYDYLLRNELRLLSKEVEIFLVEMEAKNKFLNNDISARIWLLERMLAANQLHEFELDWKELINLAEKNVAVFAIQQLLKVYSKYRMKHAEINASEIEMHLSLLNTQKEATHMFLEEEFSEIEVKKNFLIANMRAINAKVDEGKKGLIKLPIKQHKQVVEYNNLKAKSYLLCGSKKIDLLLELVKLHEKTTKYKNHSIHELSNTFGNIGLEYFLQKNYLKAHEYYLKAVNSNKSDVPNLGLLYNYSINAMLLGKHKIIQNIYASYKEEILLNEKTKHRFRYFTAISFLLDNNHNKAFRLLENDLLKRPAHEYYYYRIVYAMVYFDSSEFQLAERELNNILQSIRKNKKTIVEDKPLVLILQKLVQVAESTGNKEMYQKKLLEILKKSTALENGKENFSVIIYMWLSKKIEKLLSKKSKITT